MYATVAAGIVLFLVVVVVIDRIYQRFSHRWTNEPPLFPYTIPFVGHALMYGSDRQALFKAASDYFPDCQPYSFLFFGQRLYVFTHQKDVALVFRKAKPLPFLPLIEKLSGLAWGISPDGMKLLSQVDEKGDSLFRNAHAFYRDALKPGPALDALTVSFLNYLSEAFDDFEKDNNTGTPVSFQTWSKTMLGTASTNAMMGKALLGDNPGFLEAVFTTDIGFFFFVNRVPRMFARHIYEARDLVLRSFTKYFSDSSLVAQSVPMIRDREAQLREKGLKTEDVAAYSFSAYVAFVTNATNIAYQMIRHIYRRKAALERLRAEVAPAFTTGMTITTLEQVQFLLRDCPLLRAFYDETLRLYSASPSNRVVLEQMNIADRTIYPGHNLMCPPYIQHHTPEYFGEDTLSFNPERYLKPTLETGKPANPNMLRSFGGGISLCSGRHFAGNEVLSYAASVIWRFDIDFVQGGVKIARRAAMK